MNDTCTITKTFLRGLTNPEAKLVWNDCPRSCMETLDWKFLLSCPHARFFDSPHDSQGLLSLSHSRPFSTSWACCSTKPGWDKWGRAHRNSKPDKALSQAVWGTVGWRWEHTPAAAAAALHIPVIDGGGDISVAEAPYFQGVVITAVEGDITP